MTKAWKISPETVLRPEKESLLWFHRRSAELLELDPEGQETLSLALQGSKLRSWRARFFVHYLHGRGFLQPVAMPCIASQRQLAECLTAQAQLQSPWNAWSAPEALHVSITDHCDQRCKGCFFSNPRPGRQADRWMAWELFTRIIEEAAAHRVFQIALGGGEPLSHPLLQDMVAQITRKGMVASLTSNGNLLTPAYAWGLRQAGLGQFQISLNGASEAIHRQTRPNFRQALNAIQICQQQGLRWGLNVLVTRQNLAYLEDILCLAQQQQAWSVNLLRPKPALQGGNWLDESLTSPEENLQLQKYLKHWQKKARFLLTTDASFTFLRQGKLADWQRAGLQGCSAGRQMLSIDVEGRIAPCSHVPFKEQGNFMQIWKNSHILQRFRAVENHLQGLCSNCELKTVCRGCRALVLHQTGSFEGADQGCPKHLSTSS